MALFDDKGEVCSDPYCKIRDFLPFKCNYCGRAFCSEHYKPEDHSCSRAAAVDKRVLVCPECLEVVAIEGGDVRATWELHKTSSCRPELYQQRNPPTSRCPAKGCREKLTSVNTFQCKRCGLKVCISHRLEEDHSCSGTSKIKCRDVKSEQRQRVAAATASQPATQQRHRSRIRGLFGDSNAKHTSRRESQKSCSIQ